MMTLRKLAKYILAEPFRPFRINMTDGTSFDIPDAEMISVGKTKVRIDTWWSDDEELSKPQELVLSMSQIESIEPLETVDR